MSYEDRFFQEMDEFIANEIEDEADDINFIYSLIEEEYVDLFLVKKSLRAMFKAYCSRMHNGKLGAQDKADQDLLIFAKDLMKDLYEATEQIVTERNV